MNICKIPLRHALLALLFGAPVAFPDGSAESFEADLVIENAAVYTVDSKRTWAEAIAINEGKIVYVGDEAGLQPYKRVAETALDLHGQMVLPGFIDTHNHAYLMAESLFWLSLNSYDTVESRLAVIAQYARDNPDARQYRGVGWDDIAEDAKALGKYPKQLLDEVVPDKPLVLISNGHHRLFVNSRALDLAGIDAEAPDPAGGYFDRDEKSGEPTGVVHEFSAHNLIINALPQPDFTVAQYSETILKWQEVAGSDGLTGAFVPIHYPTENLLKAFDALDRAGKLTVRYDLGLWADESRGVEQIPGFENLRERYQGSNYHVDTIKIFSDGVGANKLVWDQDVLNETVAALDSKGFRVYIHAIGNPDFYPTRNALDAFEYAENVNGKRDARHTVTHADFTRLEDIPRFKELAVLVAPQPMWFSKDWYADTRPERQKNVFVMQSLFDAGVTVASSSDFPSDVNFKRDMIPLSGIETGITRQDSDIYDPEDLGTPMSPGERATLEEMITSYTINGAHLIFYDEDSGSIEVGKDANLVVLEENLFDIPVTHIREVEIVKTFYRGKEVFSK